MELTKQRSTIIIVGGIAIVLFGLYLFLYRPLIGKLRAVSFEYKAIEGELLRVRKNVAFLKKTDTGKIIISESELSLAIDELTREGRLKGINFVSITPGQIKEPKESAPYKILPIEMETESAYEHLGIFLGSLDKLKRSLITVENFGITTDKKDSRKLRARLVLNIYLKDRKNAE